MSNPQLYFLLPQTGYPIDNSLGFAVRGKDTGVGTGTCREVFCPSYARAITRDIYSDETNYYLSVGLNSGLTLKPSFLRKRKLCRLRQTSALLFFSSL